MSEQNNTITLYPSNWLYNAGVVGLIRIIDKSDYNNMLSFKNDGTFEIDKELFKKEKIIKNSSKNSEILIPLIGWLWLEESWITLLIKKEEKTNEEKIKKIWGTLFNIYYRGFFNANTKLLFTASKSSKPIIEQFTEYLFSLNIKSDKTIKCNFCNLDSNANYKNRLTSEHSNILGGSLGAVPNSFWNMNSKAGLRVCDFCSFVLLNHHLALTKLSDYSEIFINAPSFKVMFELNKIVKEAYGSSKSEEARSKREILATSVIEYSRKLQSTIGLWTGMNIEIVTKSKEGIDFFYLPYDVTKIISDRKIASVLSDLGEFKILNKVLDRKYADLIDMSYKLLKTGLKDYKDRSKNEKDLVYDLLYRDSNRRNVLNTANKILKLYSLIEENIRRS